MMAGQRKNGRMSFLNTYKIKKAINVLQAPQEVGSAETMQAVTTLKRLDRVAIPKMIAALGQAQTPQGLIGLLASCIHSETLALFADGLGHANPRIVAGVAEALSQATSYDPNHLLGWYGDARVHKITLSKILVSHKEQLQAEALLRCLETVRADLRPPLLGLLRHVVTAEVIPALLRRITHSDETVRLAIVRLLAPFRTPEVQQALVNVLPDPHGPIREAALDGLARLACPVDAAPLCRLLVDPVAGVRRQAGILLTQQRDPQAVRYLLDLLQEPTSERGPDTEQGLLELLATIGEPTSMQTAVAAAADPVRMRDVLMRLLEAPQARVRQLALVGLTHIHEPLDVSALCRLLWDADRAVRQHAVTLLAQEKTDQTLPMLLEALQDEAPDVRQDAMTILNTLGDTAFVRALLQALQGQAWWVAGRVTEALARHGSAAVITAAVQLSLETRGSLRHYAIEILKRSQDPWILEQLTEVLTHDNPPRQLSGVEVVSAMGAKQLVPTLLQLVATAEQALALAIVQALETLADARAIPVFLTLVQDSRGEVQQAALQALATVTDAEHAEAVLQAVMAIRSLGTGELKTAATQTAGTLIRRFGIGAVGQSSSLEITLQRPASPVVRSADVSRSAIQSMDFSSASTPQEQAQEPARLLPSPPAVPVLDVTALTPGLVLGGRYQVLRQIGQGGFGTVILVEDTMVHEQLVLKFLHPQMAADKRMIKRFIRELLYARRVTHENVIRIHDFLSISQAYAISMEYFPSHNLGAELMDRTPLPIRRALRIIWHICRGMQAAHQANIIHRDLKPQNILMNEVGVVKIVDFGLAAAASETVTRLTKTGALLGTPLYMAPEQVQNRPMDARTDIYSLGVMMYEMCTGRPPYLGANPMAILYQHLEGTAEPPHVVNPALDPDLSAVIQQAMARDPAQRFASMDLLGKQLLAFLKSEAYV